MKEYTVKHYAELSGIPLKTLQYRVHKAKLKPVGALGEGKFKARTFSESDLKSVEPVELKIERSFDTTMKDLMVSFIPKRLTSTSPWYGYDK